MTHAEVEAEAIRKYSKHMFGSQYRLEVSCAIAQEKGRFVWLTGLAESLGLPAARVYEPLQQLVRLRLLRPQPVPRGQQARYYERAPSDYWDFVLQARAEALAEVREGRG